MNIARIINDRAFKKTVQRMRKDASARMDISPTLLRGLAKRLALEWYGTKAMGKKVTRAFTHNFIYRGVKKSGYDLKLDPRYARETYARVTAEARKLFNQYLKHKL